MGNENAKIASETGLVEWEVERLRGKFDSLRQRALTSREVDELTESVFVSKFPPTQERMARLIFQAMDVERKGVVDFRQFCVAVSVLSRGSTADKVDLAFSLYDKDRKGYIDASDVTHMLQTFKQSSRSILEALGVHNPISETVATNTVLTSMNPGKGQTVTKAEFVEFCQKHPEVVEQVQVAYTALKRAAYFDWDSGTPAQLKPSPFLCATM